MEVSAVGFLLLVWISATKGELLRLCYYTSWSRTLSPQDIDPSLCTHLLFAFATLTEEAENLAPVNPRELDMYTRFTRLKDQNPHLKTMLSVGGWAMGSDLFSLLVSSEDKMHNFTTNTIEFLRKYGFDGLDLDWEYPAARGSGPEDKANFATLVKILHDGFQHEENRGGHARLLLSAAVGGLESRVAESYEVPALSRYLDIISLMMFDFHGSWEDTVNVHSALYSDNDDFNVDRFVKYWISEGTPKNKLVIGVPFYGRRFNLTDPSKTDVGSPHSGGGDIPYFSICQEIMYNNITAVRLSTERVPYYTLNRWWVGYDDEQSLREKGQYIRDNGLAGAMVWAIDLDDCRGYCGEKYPLMHALKDALRNNDPAVGR